MAGGLIYLVSGSSHSIAKQPHNLTCSPLTTALYYLNAWNRLTLNDFSTIEETVALIQGALKEIDEEGVMEVEAYEDFLYIMFNPPCQTLFILNKC